jgi:ResB-like family protein
MNNSNITRWVKPVTSLKLTVFCLACAMILVFVGTLDQVNIGVYEAENRYFKSLFLYFTPPGTTLRVPWFPGGYLVGGLLLLNLIAAHLARFKFSWRKAGILVLHAGVILLLLGQLFTSLFQVESQIRLNPGETKNYSISYYHDELAVIDTSATNFDQVISIPDSQLYKGRRILLPVDSLRVDIEEYFPNSALLLPDQIPSSNYPHLQVGPMAVAVRQDRTYKEGERNMPAATVAVWQGVGKVGSWNLTAGFPRPARFQVGGKSYQIVLRPKRFYKPFAIQLVQFSHDRYAGTDIPRNFSSRVRLVDPSRHEDRETLIYMNHPLRYQGLTFYQSGFENNDKTTILQVVQNPSWLIPYVSCGLIAFGMLFQFGMHLISFIKRRVIS